MSHKLLNAAYVIALTPEHRMYLETNDPKGLEQLDDALEDYGGSTDRLVQAKALTEQKKALKTLIDKVRTAIEEAVVNGVDPDAIHHHVTLNTATYR